MTNTSSGADSLLMHYQSLRRSVGWLGILFPFIMVAGSLLFGETGMRLSISQYYHSPMGDLFVGILCAQGVFLFAYRGYQYDPNKPGHTFFIRLSDNAAGNIAALGAVGTALFPTVECDVSGCGYTLSAYLHWFFSALFFLTLSYICLFLFVQTGDVEPTIQKKKRNRIYRSCGYIMLAAMAGAIIKGLLPGDLEAAVDTLNPIFWLETVAILAFGFSWFVKSEAIFADMVYGDEED